MQTEFDIIVVGGGHAGCEAASAAARLGSQVLLISMDIEKLAAMSCNPAVGGVAKGQIVREIDALGGQMGVITDRSTIQFRMLGRSKGAAMWSPRAQCDKTRFLRLWRQTLENTPGLFLWQDSVVDLTVEPGTEQQKAAPPDVHQGGKCTGTTGAHCSNGSSSDIGWHSDLGRPMFHVEHRNDKAQSCESKIVTGVRTALGVEFKAKAVVLTAGTFLNGLIHVGRSQTEGGRLGDGTSKGLTERLEALGFEVGRMKTGTPARIDGRTIDFGKLECQDGDANPSKFSFSPDIEPVNRQLPCYIANTSAEVHEILQRGFPDSPLFNGTIQGVGPRYCPSIEDKLRTFADKNSHQLFLEPEGVDTIEYYLNGFSSSLPWTIQAEALRHIAGFENAHILRPGYAIEYDYFPPTQLHHTLATKLIPNLYFAGQINGTTGYEEAAAQGLMAGINAHFAVNSNKGSILLRTEQCQDNVAVRQNIAEPNETIVPRGTTDRQSCANAIVSDDPAYSKPFSQETDVRQFVLRRNEAYIGVLIDDLVTKGVDEPYRMFTSRAEYRILLRQDNADMRLTPIGREIGLIDDQKWAAFEQKKSNVESLRCFVNELSIAPGDLQSYLFSRNSAPLTQGRKLSFILSRGEIGLGDPELHNALPALKNFIVERGITTEEIEQVEIEIKYRGYIERERLIAEKLHRLEEVAIPAGFDFAALGSLTMEARQKLSRIRPATIGQASRIPGVSPADINVLLVYFGR